MSSQLREWLRGASDAERERVAKAAATSVAYLWQLAGGHRKPSIELASRLQVASSGTLTLAGLRPDIQALIATSGVSEATSDRRAHLTPDDRRGRRTTDPTGTDIQALRECGERAVELAGRLAG